MASTFAENPDPTDDETRERISGNLCRCTGYHFIIDAVRDAAARLRETNIRDRV
jgi:carbon-monoxide dehydrogenase small subunit